MQPNQDYKQLLTDVIKKQIVILGPDITLSKARNVKGLTVADDGTVTAVEGSPQEITQALIDQFVQLSGLIVKKTMEPLLLATQTATGDTTQLQQAPTQQPASNAAVATPPAQPTPQPTVQQAAPTPAAPVQPASNATVPVAPTAAPQAPTETKPADNPLAA